MICYSENRHEVLSLCEKRCVYSRLRVNNIFYHSEDKRDDSLLCVQIYDVLSFAVDEMLYHSEDIHGVLCQCG